MISIKICKLSAVWGMVLGFASAQQPAERFDNLLMIESDQGIEAARKKIINLTGNIYEYGYIVVNISGEKEDVNWVLGMHHNIVKDGPFDKGLIKSYSIKFFDIRNGRQASSLVSAKDYAESVDLLWTVVVEAGVNKMLSKTNADMKYYIFCRNVDSGRVVATGQFRSCVLIAPDPENGALVEISRILQVFRSNDIPNGK